MHQEHAPTPNKIRWNTVLSPLRAQHCIRIFGTSRAAFVRKRSIITLEKKLEVISECDGDQVHAQGCGGSATKQNNDKYIRIYM